MEQTPARIDSFLNVLGVHINSDAWWLPSKPFQRQARHWLVSPVVCCRHYSNTFGGKLRISLRHRCKSTNRTWPRSRFSLILCVICILGSSSWKRNASWFSYCWYVSVNSQSHFSILVRLCLCDLQWMTFLTGIFVGISITFPISSTLCSSPLGWQGIFYFFGKLTRFTAFLIVCRQWVVTRLSLLLGGLSMAWFVAWMLLVFETPENHPRISESEKTYIQQSLKGATGAQKAVTVRCLFRQYF